MFDLRFVPPGTLRLASMLPILLWLGCGGAAERVGTASDDEQDVVVDLAEHFSGASTTFAGWTVDSTVDAHGARLGEGWTSEKNEPRGWFTSRRTATIVFDAPRPQDSLLTLRGTEPRCGKGPQAVAVELNGERLGSIELTKERERHALPVPKQAIRFHGNRLAIEAEYECPRGDRAARWDWIRLGPEGEIPDPVRLVRPDAANATLVLPRDATVSYLIDLSPESTFTWDQVTSGTADDEARVRLTLHRPGESRRPFWTETIGPSGLGRIPLGSGKGLAYLTLTASGDDARITRPMIETRRPRAPTSPDPPPRRTPLVIVFLVDTLRADHLGAYGYERPISPEIDAFAREATLYRSPTAQSSWTRSAVASLFTGLEVPGHGVLGREDALAPDGAPTLAGLLGESGFRSVGLITNGNISPQFGMDRGFNRYHVLAEDMGTKRLHRPCDDVVSVADRQLQEWLTGGGSDGLFLYVHVSDPHAPYVPLEVFRERFAPDADLALGTPDSIRNLNQSGEDVSPDVIRQLTDLYDAEIAGVDRCFGRLIDRLRSLGIYDQSLLAFTSDHGESLGDHGQFGHGISLYEEQTKVPMIVKYPGQREGKESSFRARQIDLAPTILTAAGTPVPSGLPGVDLRTADETTSRDLTYAYLALDQRRQQAVIHEEFKTIRYMDPDGSPTGWEVFSLPEDPGETRDVSRDHPHRVRRAELLLQGLEDARVESLEADIPPELDEKLRALGYL